MSDLSPYSRRAVAADAAYLELLSGGAQVTWRLRYDTGRPHGPHAGMTRDGIAAELRAIARQRFADCAAAQDLAARLGARHAIGGGFRS